MSKQQDSKAWQLACLTSYDVIRKRYPYKRLGFKYFKFDDGIQCMLLNHANEPITCIGEWSELEKGEVYDPYNVELG